MQILGTFLLGLSMTTLVAAQDIGDGLTSLSPDPDFQGYTWIAHSWNQVLPPNISRDAWIAFVAAEKDEPTSLVVLTPVAAYLPQAPANLFWNDGVGIERVTEVSLDLEPASVKIEEIRDTDLPRASPMRRYVLDKVRLQIALLGQFDSNIRHSLDGGSSFSYIPAVHFRYEVGGRRPVLVFSYDVARRDYSDTEIWGRWSHILRITAFPDQRGSFRYETAGQVARTITSHERRLADDYKLRQTLEYRLTRDYRLRFYGTLRWERFADNEDNVFRPNLGLLFEKKLNHGGEWEFEARWEVNDIDSERSRYTRLTFRMEYELPVTDSADLELEIVHRRRMYGYRQVEIEGEDRLRRDFRWVIGASWVHRVLQDVRLVSGYHVARRDSNDPDKIFQAHLFDLGLVYRL